MVKKNLMKFLALFIFILSSTHLLANETCSRTAVINYQETLVDLNSNQKGEGLRYHLEKDPIAKSHLNKYQKNTEFKWPNAILGTIGTGLILTGILTADSGKKKDTFIITGASIALVNFFIAKTFELNNENNLKKSIDEYNKINGSDLPVFNSPAVVELQRSQESGFDWCSPHQNERGRNEDRRRLYAVTL